ncbi:MAG: DUF1573 domain-containing protein [Phycisphaerae bacterium]|jgi:hypothetical protein
MRRFDPAGAKCVYQTVTGCKLALGLLSLTAVLLLWETLSILMGCDVASATSVRPVATAESRPAGSEVQATQPVASSGPTTATAPAPVEGTAKHMPSFFGTEATCNLGEIRKDSKHTVTFTIENPSGRTVRISKIRGDCGCITAVNPPKELAATGATRVKVKFVAPNVAVPYVSRLILVTDDPRRKQISLWVKCRVKD